MEPSPPGYPQLSPQPDVFPPYASPADAPGSDGKAPLRARSGVLLSSMAGGWDGPLLHAVRTVHSTAPSAVDPRHVYYATPQRRGAVAGDSVGGAGGAAAEEPPLVVLYDGYPKARVHLLILSQGEVPDTLDGLRPEELPTVVAMTRLGRRVADALTAAGGGSEAYRLGFHATPSMRPLHLHLVSTDLCSPNMRTRRHYNSFATDFFLPASVVVDQLAARGEVDVDAGEAEALLRQPLACHRCGLALRQMPQLRVHLLSCTAPRRP